MIVIAIIDSAIIVAFGAIYAINYHHYHASRKRLKPPKICHLLFFVCAH